MASKRATVRLQAETVRRLRGYLGTSATFDEVLNDLMDAVPSPAFLREHRRRLHQERRVPWESVRSRLEL